MNRMFSKNAAQNVHGWERAASVAGGLMLMGKGLRRGGLGGIVQLAMGGMALARGVSGRCEAKRILTEHDDAPARPRAQRTSNDMPTCRWTRKCTARTSKRLESPCPTRRQWAMKRILPARDGPGKDMNGPPAAAFHVANGP